MIKKKDYQKPKLSVIKMKYSVCLLDASASGIINPMSDPEDLS